MRARTPPRCPVRRRCTSSRARSGRLGGCSSCSSVDRMRTPVAPIGWPSEMPEPLTFSSVGVVPAPALQHRQHLTGEGFVELDQVHVLEAEPDAAEQLAHGRHRADAHVRRLAARGGPAHQSADGRAGPTTASLSSATTRQAAAASFCWLALPAVTVPSLISGRSLPSVAMVASARKPSSRAKTNGSPLRCGTATGTTSSSKLPASQAAAARWWLRSAKASASSRVMRVVACQVLGGLDHARDGAEAFDRAASVRARARGGRASAPSRRARPSACRWCSTRRCSCSPRRRRARRRRRRVCTIIAAVAIACSPPPQRRSSCKPGTSIGRPACSATQRPTHGVSLFAYDCANTTSSMRAGSMPLRATTCRTTVAASSSTATGRRLPPKVPTGVRKGLTMKAWRTKDLPIEMTARPSKCVARRRGLPRDATARQPPASHGCSRCCASAVSRRCASIFGQPGLRRQTGSHEKTSAKRSSPLSCSLK